MSSAALIDKDVLVKKTEKTLQLNNFDVYNYNLPDFELCFELIAKHRLQKLPTMLLKFCENIDRVNSHIKQELKLISYIISAIPLLIGQKNRRDELFDNVIYERQNLCAVNENTFKQILKHPEFPIAIAKRGGYFYDIDGTKLKELRSAQDFSQEDLGNELGISRKAVAGYENKGMRASIEHAEKLENVLNSSVVLPLDFYKFLKERINEAVQNFKLNHKHQQKFNKESIEFKQMIDEIVSDTGFKTFWPKSTPVDIFIYEENDDTKEIKNIMFFGGTHYHGKKYDNFHTQENFLQKNVRQKNEKGMIFEEKDIIKESKKEIHVPYVIPKELKLLENPKEFHDLLIRRLRKLQLF